MYGDDISDICIVGAGAAGMELAIELKNSGSKVTVIESGQENFNFTIQKLCHFQQIGYLIRTADYSSPFDLAYARANEIRLRQLGGTLNIWGRQFKMLDPIDFQPKPYLKMSGWPLDYVSEMLPYYHSVANDYGLKELLEPPSISTRIEGFLPVMNLKKAYPFDLKNAFQDVLRKNETFKLVLEANIIEIRLTENLERVDYLLARSLEGHVWKVKARLFVLACGALENARLLLASNSQVKEGIGNQYGWVGRNLLDHPKGKIGLFIPFCKQAHFPLVYRGRSQGDTTRFEWALQTKYLKEGVIPHHCIRLNALSSGLYDVKVYLEQLPSFESRLYLTDELDELKMPKICLDWKFSELDRIGFKNFIEKLQSSLNQIGHFSFHQKIYDMEFLKDASHQMGTTRMANRPEEGVADKNGQVFGINNLYLAGSSLFPTAGNANPTFTIFALSRRLGEHLKQTLNRQTHVS